MPNSRRPSEIRRSAQLRLDPSRPDALPEEFQRWHTAGFSELVAYVGGRDPVRDAETVAETLQPLLTSRV